MNLTLVHEGEVSSAIRPPQEAFRVRGLGLDEAARQELVPDVAHVTALLEGR
jgi:hypothetical protein